MIMFIAEMEILWSKFWIFWPSFNKAFLKIIKHIVLGKWWQFRTVYVYFLGICFTTEKKTGKGLQIKLSHVTVTKGSKRYYALLFWKYHYWNKIKFWAMLISSLEMKTEKVSFKIQITVGRVLMDLKQSFEDKNSNHFQVVQFICMCSVRRFI